MLYEHRAVQLDWDLQKHL